MTLRQQRFGMLAMVCLWGVAAVAQDASVTPQLAPSDDNKQQRITPSDAPTDSSTILTTHKGSASEKPAEKPAAATQDTLSPAPAAPAPLPTEKPTTLTETPKVSQPSSFAPAAKPAPGGKAILPSKVPFGHASMPISDSTPLGPHTAVASPVSDVDAVETSEPAPPTPVAPGADPVKEDPAEPTELTSPIFDESDNLNNPRKIVLRVLNKVTAQSSTFKVKPGESVKFGRLEITAQSCRVSAPNSQEDAAGLLDINEHLPGSEGTKPLFHGWMYVSSPSIAALEHPIYDVMMVDCEIAKPAPKAEAKPAGKAKK